eukprot:SAG31_NODE_675_length_12908_cov_11.596612_10_plen_645_part_00
MLGLHIAVVTDRAALAGPARAAGAVPLLAAGADPHRAAAMRRPRSLTQLRHRALARVSLISVVARAAVLRLLLAKDCYCRRAAGAVRPAGHLLRRGCRRGRGRVRAHTHHHYAGARRGAATLVGWWRGCIGWWRGCIGWWRGCIGWWRGCIGWWRGSSGGSSACAAVRTSVARVFTVANKPREKIIAGASVLAWVWMAVVHRLVLLAVRTAVVRFTLAGVGAEKIGAGPSVQAGLPFARGGRCCLAVRAVLCSLVDHVTLVAAVAASAVAMMLVLTEQIDHTAGPSILARVLPARVVLSAGPAADDCSVATAVGMANVPFVAYGTGRVPALAATTRHWVALAMTVRRIAALAGLACILQRAFAGRPTLHTEDLHWSALATIPARVGLTPGAAAPYRTRRAAAALAGRESRQSAIRRLLLVAREAAEPSVAVAHRVVEQVDTVAASGAARCTTALVGRINLVAVYPVCILLARAGVAVVVVCILRGADTVVDTRIRAAWILRRRPILVAGEPVPPCKACALEAKVRVAARAVAVARVRGAVVPRVVVVAVRTAVVRCALATVGAEKIGARPSVQAGLPTARGGRCCLAVRLPTALRSLVQRLAVLATVARRALALRLHFSKNTVGPAGPSMQARVRITHLLVPSA